MKKGQNIEMEHTSKKENMKDIFKKMQADKRAVQAYIREYATLNGFNNGTVIFAKPLSGRYK